MVPESVTNRAGCMRYWLIHAGEPLPIDGDVRLFRYGILSSMLADRGHDVVQWAGTFDHFLKRHRALCSKTIRLDENRQIELLHGRGYRRHIGLDRIRTNREMALEFRRRAGATDRPDVVVVSVPTLELADEAVAFCRRCSVPVVVDVRDLWPDVYLRILPSGLKTMGRLALMPAYRKVRRICRESTALVGISPGYLEWGLRLAGRKRRPSDRVFSHAYLKPELSEIQRETAKKQLASKGLSATGLSATGKVRFCYFGTLGRSCGLQYIIDAVRQLTVEEQQALEIVVCGTGPQLSEYQQMAEGVKSVQFLGRVSSPELIALMEVADVGLALYGTDSPQSLPNKPIEYMAGGLPILSTLRGELQTLLEDYDCGLTVPAGDNRAMISAVRELMRQKSVRARFSRNVSTLYEQHFSAEQVYSKMIDYLEALGNDASRDEKRETICSVAA